MVTIRRRFPLQPAFRDPRQGFVPVVGTNEDLGPGGSGAHARVSSGGADNIGHMHPPDRKNLSGMHAWSKNQADGGLPDGQKPPLNKGRGWQKMSIHGPK